MVDLKKRADALVDYVALEAGDAASILKEAIHGALVDVRANALEEAAQTKCSGCRAEFKPDSEWRLADNGRHVWRNDASTRCDALEIRRMAMVTREPG